MGGGFIYGWHYLTEKLCSECGGLLYGIADEKVRSSLMTFEDKRLPPIFVGKDDEALSDYLLCIRPDCRAVYRLEKLENGKKWPKLLTCQGCDSQIRHENRLGYSEITCPTDGSKYMLVISNPHIIFRQLSP